VARSSYESAYDRMNRRNAEERAASEAADRAASEEARKKALAQRPDLTDLAKQRADRLAGIQKARADAEAKAEAERQRFESMSPAERSMERGRRLKEFLGLGGK